MDLRQEVLGLQREVSKLRRRNSITWIGVAAIAAIVCPLCGGVPAVAADPKDNPEVRLQSLAAEGSKKTGWYLDIDDKGNLILSETVTGTGSTWKLTQDKKLNVYQLQTQARENVTNWYLDVADKKGVAKISKSGEHTGVWWKFVRVNADDPEKGYHLQNVGKNVNEDYYLDNSEGKIVMSFKPGTGTRWKLITP